jgi:tRNA threonylcarbamoyladenosine biosynthesis protein TsaB
MAYILNIESSTNICSVCISRDGEMLSIREASTNSHASQMTVFIEQCLAESNIKITDLSAVAISNGPGSYTSLRVGISTAKGICYGLGIPLIAVDTLTSMAMAAYEIVKDDTAIYCPMIDARRMEVYHSLFEIEDGEVKIIEPMSPLIVDEQSFKRYYEVGKRLVFSGNGSLKCAAVLPLETSIFVDENCSSKNMIKYGTANFDIKNFVDIAYHTPQYLKAPNITTPKNVINT